MDEPPLLSVRSVSKRYRAGNAGPLGFGRRRFVHALDAISLEIAAGEVLGLVGESGSGKSTLGRLIVGLEPPSAGALVFAEGHARPGASSAQMVFQNPTGSLNPRQRVLEIIAEPIRVHRPSEDAVAVARALMERVGLPAALAERRPHEMSGGQCQRVGIARALALNPMLLVCDEPVSALDVSIQAQVLNLLADLQEDTGCAILFISHDLPVVERLSHRIAIMYLGRIVELAPTAALFGRPVHPYTQALIESAPRLDQRRRGFMPVQGEIPSPLTPPSGCHFHPRCPFAMERCRSERPLLREVGPGHVSACHLDP